MKKLRDLTISFVSMVFMTVCLIAPVQASMIETHAAGQNSIMQIQKNKVIAFIEREEVKDTLAEQGVNLSDIQARVNTMTPAEINLLNANIDAVPAGGDVLTIIFVTFVVLLITDIAGFTDIFPFVVKHRK